MVKQKPFFSYRIITAVKFFILTLVICACQISAPSHKSAKATAGDRLVILKMIQEREQGMQTKDLAKVMNQFREDATYINSGGYYFKNKSEIEKFHRGIMLSEPGYSATYQAGNPTINILSAEFALAYYPWQIITIKTSLPADTLVGTGLMTLTAQKDTKGWKWRAITNQQTKEFFEDLETHTWKLKN